MSLRYWIYLFSALFVLTGTAGQSFAQTPPDPRVGIAIHLVIDAESVKERLRDDLPTVTDRLESALKKALQEYGFLNWNAPSSQTKYTVVVRIVEANELIKDIQLEIAARGPGVIKMQPVSLKFEGFLVRKDWSPNVVISQWSSRIEEIVHTQRRELVSSVLGLTPLHASVSLLPEQLTANVRIQPRGIRASSYPPPKFLVRAKNVDPGPPFETEGFAELALGGCNNELHTGTYICDIEGIKYKGKPMLPAGHYFDMMSRARIEVQSLHVREYWPSDELPGGSVIAGVTTQ